MRIEYRIPTEQYAFVDIQESYPPGVRPEPEEVRMYYEALKEAFRPVVEGGGATLKEFNGFLDGYMSSGKPGEMEVWERMSMTQKTVINEVKKALKRITK